MSCVNLRLFKYSPVLSRMSSHTNFLKTSSSRELIGGDCVLLPIIFPDESFSAFLVKIDGCRAAFEYIILYRDAEGSLTPC